MSWLFNVCSPCCTQYVTTRKYTPSGELVWNKDHGASVFGVAVDSAGNVYTGGSVSSLDGMTTRKYDGDGNLLWSVRHDPSSTGVLSICTDDTNLYVASAARLTCYDTDGNEVWTKSSGDYPFGVNSGNSICPQGGNVWVGGRDSVPIPGNQIQRIQIGLNHGENYTLTFNGETTPPIPFFDTFFYAPLMSGLNASYGVFGDVVSLPTDILDRTYRESAYVAAFSSSGANIYFGGIYSRKNNELLVASDPRIVISELSPPAGTTPKDLTAFSKSDGSFVQSEFVGGGNTITDIQIDASGYYFSSEVDSNFNDNFYRVWWNNIDSSVNGCSPSQFGSAAAGSNTGSGYDITMRDKSGARLWGLGGDGDTYTCCRFLGDETLFLGSVYDSGPVTTERIEISGGTGVPTVLWSASHKGDVLDLAPNSDGSLVTVGTRALL